jgi:hypothetical protein
LFTSLHTRLPRLTHGETEQGSVAMVATPEGSVSKLPIVVLLGVKGKLVIAPDAS